MIRDIYLNSNFDPFKKFSSSHRNTEFRHIHPWNIFQLIIRTFPICTRIVKAVSWKVVFLFEAEGETLVTNYDTLFPETHAVTHPCTGTHTSKFMHAIYCTGKIVVLSLFVLLLLHISCNQKCFTEGFSI